jgi:phosphatidylcholine synthase
MGWVPGPAEWSWLWVAPALVASLLGFANLQAKDESGGFFRGFPSYWNILALYLGILAIMFPTAGPWVGGMLVVGFAFLTVAPVWFVYPNLAPPPWRLPVIGGAVVWLIMVLAMLPFYPDRVPGWLVLLSLVYPAFYIVISIHLWRRRNRLAA